MSERGAELMRELQAKIRETDNVAQIFDLMAEYDAFSYVYEALNNVSSQMVNNKTEASELIDKVAKLDTAYAELKQRQQTIYRMTTLLFGKKLRMKDGSVFYVKHSFTDGTINGSYEGSTEVTLVRLSAVAEIISDE